MQIFQNYSGNPKN